jgi:hypothetical protein
VNCRVGERGDYTTKQSERQNAIAWKRYLCYTWGAWVNGLGYRGSLHFQWIFAPRVPLDTWRILQYHRDK